MLTIVAKCMVKKGNNEQFLRLAKELVEETRKEQDCISYSLLQDTDNAQIFTFLEVWKDKEALDIHGNTTHFTTIVPQLSELQSEETQVNIYEEV